MLSHQYQPFSHLPTPNMVSHEQHLAAQHMGPSPLDTLAHTSQYAALQFHHNQRHVLPHQKGLVKQHRMPYSNGPIAAAPRNQREAMLHERAGRGAATSGPVRRRISRACDQCNQLRTKCDGKAPCAHCMEFGLTCEYVRERKKRGKASRKDIAQQQAAAAAAAGGNPAPPSGDSAASGSPQSRSNGFGDDQKLNVNESTPIEPPEGQRPLPELPPPSLPTPGRSASMATTRGMEPASSMYQNVAPMARTMSMGAIDRMPENGVHQMNSGPMQPPRIQTTGLQMHDRNGSIAAIPEYASMDDFNRNIMHHSPHPMMHNGMTHPIIPSNGMPEYTDSPYSMMSPQSAQAPPNAFRMPVAESPMPGFVNSPVAGSSPGWLSLPSPSTTMYPGAQHMNASQQLRYPVLQPLVPHLTSIIPVSLACDLLELYFQSSSSAFMQPISPYVLGYVFRKRSFLRQNNPRVCSPALLASMLWIGAQTSESPYLTSQPSARGQICEKLLNLTISLLKPLIHSSPSSEASPTYSNAVINGVALGGFGMPAQENDRGSSPGATGGLDDVATYMHLAIVVSASEYKAASLRWWNAAFQLARELKFGREVPNTPPPEHEEDDADAHGELDMDHLNGNSNGQNSPVNPTEEQREERRRIWWLLYTMDRHLALCYNRPLFLLDVECDGLLQPVNDSLWQAGEFFNGDSAQSFSDPTSPYFRRRGPSFDVTGHSIFGFFLPLMTILGEIVDLNHARNHPRFGIRFKSGSDWDDHAAEITRQLEAYGDSLQEFKTRAINEANAEAHEAMQHEAAGGTPSGRSVNSTSSRAQESLLLAKIVVAYGTHLMHTLHILLNGKWDPISLLDDNDLWISSQSFIDATGHAVSAAEAINEILEHDPDLSFMPFFFGIYLLQGSFLLLLIADKLQGDANPNVVKACETIVRAHEACVVTLNTEYQRNFRKVMRSALSQVRGRGGMDEFGGDYAQLHRRQVLSLYRWTGDGTGLAL
ncbi:fungal-specific transcription factor domain-domain-containing protein [Clohesyomyces aquaticus]|uniref:Fungal-specific transcription factor domain-domain-containing protein n=1 Tax=Clohesyomyces aquaticus TaxID=1231657 RepID=A0A1Y1YFY7_9PLEO|nr:fungal-specific transcription factor domain-domain-containing protein [Clohesyomyces aquaticus]